MSDKPTVVADWAGTGTITDPGAGKRSLGWVAEDPPFEFFNYLHNASGLWQAWLDENFSDGPTADDFEISPPGDLILSSGAANRIKINTGDELELRALDGDETIRLVNEDDGETLIRWYESDGSTEFLRFTVDTGVDAEFRINSNNSLNMASSGICSFGQGAVFNRASDFSATDGRIWTRNGLIKTSDASAIYSAVQKVFALSTTTTTAAINASPVRTNVYTIPASMLEVGSTITVRVACSVASVTTAQQFILEVGLSDGSDDFPHVFSNTPVDANDQFIVTQTYTIRAIGASGNFSTHSYMAWSDTSVATGVIDNDELDAQVSSTVFDTDALTVYIEGTGLASSDLVLDIETVTVEIAR